MYWSPNFLAVVFKKQKNSQQVQDLASEFSKIFRVWYPRTLTEGVGNPLPHPIPSQAFVRARGASAPVLGPKPWSLSTFQPWLRPCQWNPPRSGVHKGKYNFHHQILQGEDLATSTCLRLWKLSSQKPLFHKEEFLSPTKWNLPLSGPASVMALASTTISDARVTCVQELPGFIQHGISSARTRMTRRSVTRRCTGTRSGSSRQAGSRSASLSSSEASLCAVLYAVPKTDSYMPEHIGQGLYIGYLHRPGNQLAATLADYRLCPN